MTIEVRIRKFYKMSDRDGEVEMVPAVSFLCPDSGPTTKGIFTKANVALDKAAAEAAAGMEMGLSEMTEQEIKDYRASEDEEP